jgi:uncharacterized repeat protein (TIGR01451 family)
MTGVKKYIALIAVVTSLGLAASGFIWFGVFAATTPSLGVAASYGVLATTYTNTAAGTTINGDVGFTVGPAVEPDPVGGHTNYGSGGSYATAGTDQGTALSALDAQGCTTTFPAAVDLFLDTTHGTAGVYTPGVYCSVGAMSSSGSITLSGSGTYIFRSIGALDTTAGITVNLADGASACDVFWTPSGDTTLGAGTAFKGTAIQNGDITIGANTVWQGRALAFSGSITSGVSSSITVPSCTPPPATLHVVKQVVNNNGGVAVAADFSLHVKNSGTDVTGSPTAGIVAPGVSYSLVAGTYVVSEDANPGYTQTLSGDCDSSGNVALASGEDKTCTITNDDRPGSVAVVKTVVNNSGGTKNVADFPLFVSGMPIISGVPGIFNPGSYTVTETGDPDYTQTFSGDCDSSGGLSLSLGDAKVCTITNDDIGVDVIPPVPPLIAAVKVPNPLTLSGGSGSALYTYTLRNIGTVTATNVTMVDDSCSPLTYMSGDTNANSQLEISEVWIYTCQTSLSVTHTNNATATALANGITATDIASATVVVGSPIVPPLIHVTNVPNPLTVTAGGLVIYTQQVTNPGTAPLSNVTVTNDTFPLNYISGDTNNDSKLDSTETWTYTGQAILTQTMTTTTTATGEANGLQASDFAFATVVVGAASIRPPNTGFGSSYKYKWIAIISIAAVVILSLSYLTLKKRPRSK